MSTPIDLAERTLAAVSDAVVAIDSLGTIVAWSGSAERLLGLPAEKAVGQHLLSLFPSLARDRAEDVFSLGGADRLETVRHMRGTAQAVALTITPLRDEEGRRIGATGLVRPMGGWLDPAEQAGRPRRQWHRTLGRVVEELVEEAEQDPSAMDASETLARVLVGQARRVLPTAECVLVVVPRDRQDMFRVMAGAGPWAERLVGSEHARAGTVSERTLVERRPWESTRLQELSPKPDALASGGIISGRLVPLLSARPLPDGREALGVLHFYRTTRAYFTPYERRLMAELARLVTLSLQRAELLRGVADAAARLKAGVDVAMELAHSLRPEDVFGRLVRRAASAVDAERVALLLIEDTEAVVVDAYDRTGSGQSVPAGERFPIAELLSGSEPVILRAVNEQRPLRTGGAYRVRGASRVSEWGQAGLRHTLTLPLVLSGEVVAVLLVSRLRDMPFRREDALTLQHVGNVAVLALRNSRLFAEAQEASRSRSDFLNMAGHELRTPLTVIKGYLSMLSDGSLGRMPDAIRQPVDLLVTKADELSGLVDDLLFTSRLEAGNLPAHPMRLDIRIAAQEAFRRAEPRAKLLGGDLGLEVAGEPLVVSADPEHVARILDNLVNNALTYRRPGQPAWVRLVAAVDGGQAVISVEDHGRGVPPELRERIFERFVRGEQGSGGTTGTGLGLYISRQLAARHGGRLELERSEPGQGSLFTLRLPRVAAAS